MLPNQHYPAPFSLFFPARVSSGRIPVFRVLKSVFSEVKSPLDRVKNTPGKSRIRRLERTKSPLKRAESAAENPAAECFFQA